MKIKKERIFALYFLYKIRAFVFDIVFHALPLLLTPIKLPCGTQECLLSAAAFRP